MKHFIRTKKINRSVTGNVFLFLFLAMCGLFMFLPFIYTILGAFKPLDELFLYPPRFIPMRPTTDNFVSMAQMISNLWVPFSRYLFNTVMVTVIGTIFCVYMSSMAAYPLAKRNFRGKKLIYSAIVMSLLFTPEVTNTPRYIVMSKMDIIDSYFAVLFPVFAGALGTFLMFCFMSPFPDEIIESASIDGAGQFRTFHSIVMPSMKPAWLTLVLFTFSTIWNNPAEDVLYSENLKMLPTVFRSLSAGGIARAGVSSAVALFVLLPPMILFISIQSSVIETMSQSGMKG